MGGRAGFERRVMGAAAHSLLHCLSLYWFFPFPVGFGTSVFSVAVLRVP